MFLFTMPPAFVIMFLALGNDVPLRFCNENATSNHASSSPYSQHVDQSHFLEQATQNGRVSRLNPSPIVYSLES